MHKTKPCLTELPRNRELLFDDRALLVINRYDYHSQDAEICLSEGIREFRESHSHSQSPNEKFPEHSRIQSPWIPDCCPVTKALLIAKDNFKFLATT